MAFFMRRVRNRSDAEDLTQETFARLSSSTTFDPSGEPNAYVFRVASNLLHDRARTASRLKHPPISALDPELVERLAAEMVEDNGPERVLIGRQGLAAAIYPIELDSSKQVTP
jgi:RNA polymerase sigma-70 factor (ECF subfamily)